MESIRKFLKSWPGRIFLMFCLSPFLILGLESYFTGGANNDAVVTVGEQAISRTQYQTQLAARRNELIQSGVEPSNINTAALSEEVLDNLINRALLEQQTKKLGMHVSDRMINNMLLKEPQYLDENGEFSNERFAFALQQQGITKEQLFEQYSQQLNIIQLYNSVAQNAIVSQSGVDELLDAQLEKQQVWLHRLPWQDYQSRVAVTDAEIQAYYDEHQSELNSVAMVDLAYVVLDPLQLEVEPVTEADIEQQYDAYRASYAGDYEQKISQILITGAQASETIAVINERLANGENFADLAKEFSEDASSRNNGGAIGTFNREAFGKDGDKVAQALDGLSKGEVSAPIKTSFGYQIFQVTSVNGKSAPTLESMREQLIDQVARRKRVDLVSDKIARINEMAIDGLSVQDIAQQEALSADVIKDYPKVDNQTLLNQPAVIEAAFDDFTIQDESVSTGITNNNVTVWVQPSNYRPVAPLSLEQATPSIKQVITKEKAIAQALVDAERIAALVSNEGMDAVPVDFTNAGAITRQNTHLLATERAAIFSEKLAVSERKAIAQTTPMGASVLVVEGVAPSADSISAAVRQQNADALKQRRGQEAFTDYLEYLKTAYPVVRNDSVYNDVVRSGR